MKELVAAAAITKEIAAANRDSIFLKKSFNYTFGWRSRSARARSLPHTQFMDKVLFLAVSPALLIAAPFERTSAKSESTR